MGFDNWNTLGTLWPAVLIIQLQGAQLGRTFLSLMISATRPILLIKAQSRSAARLVVSISSVTTTFLARQIVDNSVCMWSVFGRFLEQQPVIILASRLVRESGAVGVTIVSLSRVLAYFLVFCALNCLHSALVKEVVVDMSLSTYSSVCFWPLLFNLMTQWFSELVWYQRATVLHWCRLFCGLYPNCSICVWFCCF